MEYVYKTRGTCSTNIELNVEDGVVKEVVFWGGCNGNLQGISRVVRGMLSPFTNTLKLSMSKDISL